MHELHCVISEHSLNCDGEERAVRRAGHTKDGHGSTRHTERPSASLRPATYFLATVLRRLSCRLCVTEMTKDDTFLTSAVTTG
jgi:hypothetical protein